MNHQRPDRKSTRLNSSHSQISYAVFCLKKKKRDAEHDPAHVAELVEVPLLHLIRVELPDQHSADMAGDHRELVRGRDALADPAPHLVESVAMIIICQMLALLRHDDV